jgi:hypothetical protein
MRTCLVVLLVGLVFIFPGVANGGVRVDNSSRAEDLHKFCKPFTVESQPSVEKAYCRGYMVGWRGGIEGATIPDEKGFLQVVTFQEGVTDEQMARVFVSYMDSHPEEENKAPHVALLHSMLNGGLVSLGPPDKTK